MLSISYSALTSATTETYNAIHQILDQEGVVIIHDYISDGEELEHTKQRFQAFCSHFGLPIGHDREETIIWDIKSTPTTVQGESKVITYSQHSHEADLHTDSQYSAYPEDYFALLTLHKAECGGGISYLLSLKDILAELESSEAGKKAKHILETTTYPFIVPSIFKQRKEEKPEFNYGHIIKNGEIRFRVDTIQKALDYDQSLCTTEQVEAFNFMVNLVRSTNNRKTFFLENGDLVLINNKNMLHGRGSFTDPKRHLLRIRMNKHQNQTA